MITFCVLRADSLVALVQYERTSGLSRSRREVLSPNRKITSNPSHSHIRIIPHERARSVASHGKCTFFCCRARVTIFDGKRTGSSPPSPAAPIDRSRTEEKQSARVRRSSSVKTMPVLTRRAGRCLSSRNDSRTSRSSRASSRSTPIPSTSWSSPTRRLRSCFKQVGGSETHIDRVNPHVRSFCRSSVVRLRCLSDPPVDYDRRWYVRFDVHLSFSHLRSSLGISNLEECPLNRNIPVFVLVGGAIASLKLLQVLYKQYNRRRGPAEEEATDTHNGSVGSRAASSDRRSALRGDCRSLESFS